MDRIKVLVVDDSAFYRQTISGMLKTSPRLEIIGAVSNGSEAIRFLAHTTPDVIALDLEMPMMDGFTFLPVVVISSRSESENVFKALDWGAVDFVAKPTQRASLEIMNLQAELVAKVETAGSISASKLIRKEPEKTPKGVPAAPPKGVAPVKIVAIGASTGGPPAVQSIITHLPKDFPAAVVVSQHMPPGFTLYFAERLAKAARLPVKEGAQGDRVEAGKVYICPGGHHLQFSSTRKGTALDLKARADADRYSPSVDRMMISAVEFYGNQVLGILLTGMGSDGKLGMKAIKDGGGTTIAESEETCVVFGMPKEAISLGVVDEVLPLFQIPQEVVRRCPV